MDKIIIEGGYPLEGEVVISGAKNAALPLIASTLLAAGGHVFDNVPDLVDIKTLLKLLDYMGVRSSRNGKRLEIDTRGADKCEAPYDLVRTMRAAVLVLGPLLARFGQARVSLPGGCAIGARPINLHLKALEKMGVNIDLEQGYVIARVDGLKGAPVYFDVVSVTGTENVMMAATLARGTTVIKNAACEPEVAALADYLVKMGARIKGAGTDTIVIEGVSELRPGHCNIIPDRIEAGTYMIAAGLTGGDLFLRNCQAGHLQAAIAKLRETGLVVDVDSGGMRVRRNGPIRSVDVKTQPYPGFPTDLQAQMMVLMTMGNGLSVITETIFENRFMLVGELQRMGAVIIVEGRSAIIKGGGNLLAAPVMATDLRASASLILAGLVAEGKTEVSRVYHLDRGYERLEEKLSSVGAHIWRVKNSV
ncbi:MAG: UDP-N-acetylglucosamine 1-carboxyvinyltransferase [Deltaproteobacteria bacterium]|nr:UDP-N-acetylglucosamine 1-carboxyvinyltransferase [Deltaproteobacteria bacterium]